MEILWENRPASAGGVATALPKRQPLAYNKVLIVLRIILEQRDTCGTRSRGGKNGNG